jgi:hypothetical protein
MPRAQKRRKASLVTALTGRSATETYTPYRDFDCAARRWRAITTSCVRAGHPLRFGRTNILHSTFAPAGRDVLGE